MSFRKRPHLVKLYCESQSIMENAMKLYVKYFVMVMLLIILFILIAFKAWGN